MPQKLFLILSVIISASGNVYSHTHSVNVDPVQQEAVRDDFAEWLRCSVPGAENCTPCEDKHELTDDLNRVIGINCLPPRSQRNIVFNSALTPEQQRDRDDSICACYLSSPTRATPAELHLFTQNMARSPLDLRNSNLNTEVQHDLNEAAEAERIQAGLSAASYRSTTAEAIALGSRYSSTPAVSTARNWASKIQATVNSAVGLATSAQIFTYADMMEARQAVQGYQFRPEDFNGPDKEGYCVPYRHFLASKQFPEQREFYEGLQAEGSTFLPDEWNYVKLVSEFKGMRQSRDMEAIRNDTDPKMRRHLARMEFLHNNPVIKNIFLAPGNDQVKQELFSIIKDMPRPECGTTTGCIRNDNWNQNMRSFRTRIADFLTNNPAAPTSAEAGFEVSLDLNQRITALRAERNVVTSTKIYGAPRAATDPTIWSSFCYTRQGTAPQDLTNARELADLFGDRNFAHPEMDDQYEEYNRQICQTKRRDGYNQDMTFQEYLLKECSGPNANLPKCSPDNRTDLVAHYLSYSTDMNNPNGNTAAQNIIPLLSGNSGSGLARVKSSDVPTINRLSANPVLADRNLRSVSQNSTTLNPRAGSIASADIQGQTLIGPTAMGLPQSEQIVVPQARAQVPLEESRTSLTQGEEDARQLREQISSLRDVIRREPAESRESQAMLSLNQRLVALENRLQAKERENEELRDQIEEEDDRQESAQRIASSPVNTRNRRSDAVAAQSASQGGSTSGSEIGGSISSIGSNASPSSVAGRTSIQSSRPVISSGNAALLSKYGVNSGSVEGGIIVANPSGSIDYQSLQSQSEGNILPVSLTPEEFNLVASNNQEALRPYFDQCRAMTGEVCRLSITSQGSQNAMELYLLKNGNDISVVPSNSSPRRSIASENVPTGREFTLNSLRNELGQ